MGLTTMEILLWIVTVIAAWFIGRYFPSYMKKKAENLATKEDIGKITKEIETVRSSLEIVRDAHVALINERKEVLIKFYDQVTSFLYELLVVDFGDFPMDEGQSLFKYQNDFDKAIAEILKTYQRVVIYFPLNSKLLSKALTIANDALEARNALKKKFGAIKFTSVEEQISYANIVGQNKQIYKEAVEAANEASKKYWSLMNPIAISFKDHYRSFLTELNEYLQGTDLNT